ncbi:hypothetical protein [Myroides sp. LJL119]
MKDSIVFVIDGKQSKNRIRNLEAKICCYLGQSQIPWFIYITKTDMDVVGLANDFLQKGPRTVVVSGSENLAKQIQQILCRSAIGLQILPMTKNTLILQKLSPGFLKSI